jgi:hypothetical protein
MENPGQPTVAEIWGAKVRANLALSSRLENPRHAGLSTFLERGLEAVRGLRARFLSDRAGGDHTLARTGTAESILSL